MTISLSTLILGVVIASPPVAEKANAAPQQKPPTRKEILDSIEKGGMSVKEATFILKNRK